MLPGTAGGGTLAELFAARDLIRYLEAARGVDAIAQVDLGRRAHSHQPLLDLGAMATQILTAAWARSSHSHHADAVPLTQFLPPAAGREGAGPVPRVSEVPVVERPPAAPLL